MITDDPGTPGSGHWEVNLAWTEQQSPGTTLVGIPLLDANYGIGDRIQLNYQGSWNEVRGADEPTQSGTSDSQIAVKWRFYDAGETGLQLSMYPRFTFLNPGSDSDRRGTADSSAKFLLPFEMRRDFGVVAVNVDLGYTASADSGLSGWAGGVCIGKDVLKGWELDVEAHADGSGSLKRTETMLNLGTRVGLSDHATLLLAVGKDAHNSAGPAVSLLTYVGIQIRL
jgi:hypothetical protein